jgi:dolichyl-phosphate beta-glucosyltransferase
MMPPMTDRAAGNVFLSLVIPAYNEASRIGPTLEKIIAYLARRGEACEIIVVDDGSGDGTAATARDAIRGWPRARVLSLPKNRGKGYAVREGVLASSGRAILYSDSDLSAPIEELDKLLPDLDRGYDAVIGSRALPGSDIRIRQSALRESMGKAFNLLVRLLVLPGVRDTQCGFKLLRREVALDVFGRLRIRGFAFDVEALALCRKMGYKVKETPVVWMNSPPSRVRIVRSSAGMLRDLLRIWWSMRPFRYHKVYGRS